MWSIALAGDGAAAADLVRDGLRSVLLAGAAAFVAVLAATVVVYGRRTRPSRARRAWPRA